MQPSMKLEMFVFGVAYVLLIYITLTHERLCTDTESVLKELCHFLGISFDPAMLVRQSTATHHIGGSPSKFDMTKSKVALDTSFPETFSAEQLAYMHKVAGIVAARWGYPSKDPVPEATTGPSAG